MLISNKFCVHYLKPFAPFCFQENFTHGKGILDSNLWKKNQKPPKTLTNFHAKNSAPSQIQQEKWTNPETLASTENFADKKGKIPAK